MTDSVIFYDDFEPFLFTIDHTTTIIPLLMLALRILGLTFPRGYSSNDPSIINEHTTTLEPHHGIIATTLQQLIGGSPGWKSVGKLSTTTDYGMAICGVWEGSKGIRLSEALKREVRSTGGKGPRVAMIQHLLQSFLRPSILDPLTQRFAGIDKRRIRSLCQQARIMIDGIVSSKPQAREKGRAMLKDSQSSGIQLDLALWRTYMMMEAGGEKEKDEALRVGKMALGLLAQVGIIHDTTTPQ